MNAPSRHISTRLEKINAAAAELNRLISEAGAALVNDDLPSGLSDDLWPAAMSVIRLREAIEEFLASSFDEAIAKLEMWEAA